MNASECLDIMAGFCTVISYISLGVILVMGAITIGGSMYLIFGYNYTYLNRELFDESIQQLNSMIAAINRYPAVRLAVSPDFSNATPATEFNSIFREFGYFTLAFGVLVCAITIPALVATIRKLKMLTTMYVVGMVVFLIIEVVFLIIYLQFPSVIMSYVESYLLESIKESYQGLSGQDDASIGWNLLMKRYNCCGVQSYQDFHSAEKFSDTWGEPFHTKTQLLLLPAPLACCNLIQITPHPRFNGPCHKADYITKKGCGSLVFHGFFEEYKHAVVGIIMVLCLSQIITIVTGIYSKSKNNEAKDRETKIQPLEDSDF